MNKKYIDILIKSIAVAFTIFGIIAIGLYTKEVSKKDELQQTIENQNKLIKILEVSCECECDE